MVCSKSPFKITTSTLFNNSLSPFSPFSVFNKKNKDEKQGNGSIILYIINYIYITLFCCFSNGATPHTENWKHWKRCAAHGATKRPDARKSTFHEKCRNVLEKHRTDWFFRKKYPQTLDNAFLRQYLCTCHPEDNTNHFSILNSQNLIFKEHGKISNLLRCTAS